MFPDETLIDAAQAFFNVFSAPSSASTKAELLSFFSTTAPVFVQHTHVSCPHPHTSRLCGLNAVRSYFDILDTHWIRSHTSIRTAPHQAQGLTTSSPSTRPLPGADSEDQIMSSPSSSPSPSPFSTSPTTPFPVRSIDTLNRSITLDVTTTWKWRKSGHTWVEDYILTLHFDDALSLTQFVAVTVSAPETCVLRAVDETTLGCLGVSSRRSSDASAPVSPGSPHHPAVVPPAAGAGDSARRLSAARRLSPGYMMPAESKSTFGSPPMGGNTWTRGPDAVFLV